MENNVKKPSNNMKIKKNVAITVRYIILCLFALFFMFPFVYMVLKSFMTDKEVMTLPIKLFPEQLYFGAYAKSFSPELIKYFVNTVIVLVVNMVAIPLTSALCAYGFTKIKFFGRDLVFGILLSTMMLPAAVTQIPIYIMYIDFGWLNTLFPLTIPAFFGGGVINIFLCKQY